MVAEGADLASQSAQHPQFRRICVEDSLHQRAHGEVSGIQHQDIGVLRFGPVDQCLDFGKAAQCHILTVLHRKKAVQVGVGVV